MFHEEVENREVLARASQHFVIDHLVHVLSEDICSLSRNSKEKLDVLGDLESRVKKLRYTNMHGSSSRPWADRQVDVDLKEDLSRPNAMLFKVCSKCNAIVLKKVLDMHERFCHGAVESPEDQPEDDGNEAEGAGGEAGEEGDGASSAQKENMKPCQFCRRPFRNERLAKHEEACKKKTKAIAQRSDKSERARNAIAKMAPRPPRNLRVIAKTCDQVALAWEPPIIDGGAMVFEHEVSYSVHEVIRKDKYSKEDVTTPAEPVLTSRWCAAKPVATNGFTLTGLKANTHLVNISVRCQNEIGWSDTSEVVPEVFTEDPLPPSPPLFFRLDSVRSNRAVLRWTEPLFKGGREVTEYELVYTDVVPKDQQAVTTKKIEEDRHHERLTDELKRARAATGGWIDTDFYKDFMQRENREDYIAKLERDLASLPNGAADETDSDNEWMPSQAETQSQRSLVPNRSVMEDERLKQQEEFLESVFHGYKRRKAQFEYRLKRLREQARVMEVHAELDRVATFSGGHINSSVLHGSQQRFPIKALRQKLRQEFEAGQASIATDKANLVEGTKTSLWAMQLKLKREAELKERIAAFAVFSKNAEKAKKLSGNLQANKQSVEAIKEKIFSALVAAVKTIQQERATILNALVRMRMRLICAAFTKWRTGKHIAVAVVEDSSKYVIRGIGGRHLMQAEDGRELLEKELQVVMRDAASLRRDFTRMGLTNKQKKALEGSTVFHETELGSFVDDSQAEGLDTALIAQGDGFMKVGEASKAVVCYSRQVKILGKRTDRMGLCALGVAYARLAKGQKSCDRVDIAAVSFERDAISLFKRALARNVEIKDLPRDARLFRLLEKAHRRMVDEEQAKVYAERAEAIENEMESKLIKAKASLEESTKRLVGRTANSAKVVRLERVTAGYVAMCSRRTHLQENLKETLEAKKTQAKVVKGQELKLQLIKDQLQEAMESDRDAMSSTLIVEGEMMSFEIEELKIRLREREIEVSTEVTRHNGLLTNLTNRATNAVDELEGLEQDIAIEGGPLMTSVVAKARIRLIGMNPSNTAGNEVEGTATGGVEKIAAAEGKKVLVYGIAKGNLEHVFNGDEPGRHTGELLGHSGVITALFFYKHMVYTGSMDCTVQVWDVNERKRVMVLQGHEATVCSVVADEHKIVSGASFILSGGADGDIRLWGAAKVSKFSKASANRATVDDEDELGRYESKRRLAGHYRSATCVSYGRLELVSGHEDGTVIVWWASTGLIMMKSKVHEGPVQQLQFDAIKVVSCSTDGTITVTDLTTGDCTMTLRGHEGIVLAVAFDRSKIMSASDDGTLRTWDKYAVLGPGDNLGRLAKENGTTVADIAKWNGVRDTRQLGVGVRLIVAKGNPNEPTAAEKDAEAARALKERRSKTIEKARKRSVESAGGTAERRRQRGTLSASDDPSSLVGRIAREDASFSQLWQEARRLEIVRGRADANGDRNLAGRVRERIRVIAEEAAVLDSDSDGDSKDSDRDEEGVLAKQAREREQSAVDITNAVLGAIVKLLAKEIVRDAVGSAAPSKGIVGRLNAYYAYNSAIDTANDAAAAEAEKQQEEQELPPAASPAGDDHGGSGDEPTVRLPPIEQVAAAGVRPRSASRPISPERLRRIDGMAPGVAVEAPPDVRV
eukprot:g6190.t1